MRRFSTMLFIMILCLAGASLACQAAIPAGQPTIAEPSSATPSAPPTASLQPSVTPAPNTSPTAPASDPTAFISPDEIATTQPLTAGFTVRYHPEGELYVGDAVSLEVIAPPGLSLDNSTLTVTVASQPTQTLGSQSFGPWGVAGRYQATLMWAWDTQASPPGDYTLSFTVQPQEYTWSETVTLLPASQMPLWQRDAAWAVLETTCCTIHYITGTAAERDLEALAMMIDQEAEHAAAQMNTDFSQKVTLTILPRLLGHGGFTNNEVSVSYLDRNYAGNAWDRVVHHEMIHILDRRLDGDLRPTLFVEGLAVYMSGGHYKEEALMPRAAALLMEDLNWYLPLAPLADDFYAAQHEISYLEAAALVEYMTERWGWEAFSNFYRQIHPASDGLHSTAIDATLQAHFGLSFAQLEQDFIAALRTEPGAEAWREDIRLTVLFYDTLRRYQEMLDPSAYFRTAWLLNSADMRTRGIVADYLRHPSAPANLALEAMLGAASRAVMGRDFLAAEQIIAAVNAVLDGYAQHSPDPFAIHLMAIDYRDITLSVIAAGYEPQQISLAGDTASVLATAEGAQSVWLDLQRATAWQIP